jgi:hypothetical protein
LYRDSRPCRNEWPDQRHQLQKLRLAPGRALSRAKPTSPKCIFLVLNLQYISAYGRRE